MKRIAYVSDAWHGYVSYVMPKALLDSFSDYEEDVILCHFNSFGSWSRNEKNNAGEYGIYDLPDFTGFDGIDGMVVGTSWHAKLTEPSSFKHSAFVHTLLLQETLLHK